MSRRDQIHMSDVEIREFLAAGKALQVASINADGTPHLVAMWYALLGDDVAFWTYGKSQKVVNLRRDPRFACLVEDGDVYEELRGVQLNGHAEIVDDAASVLDFGMRLYQRYWGGLDDDAARAGIEQQSRKRVVVVMKAGDVVSWDHRKLGGGY